MRPVDPEIPILLHRMHEKQVPMIVLTKRDPLLASLTLEHLSLTGIDFQKAAPIKESAQFEELNHSIYRKGILFCGAGVDKGILLLEYLKKLEKMPRRIVFIDDKMDYVLSVEKAVEKAGIAFVGIRYGRADERFKELDPRIAEIQQEHLHKILSDEQALLLLKLKN
jgi:hypothetical protein